MRLVVLNASVLQATTVNAVNSQFASGKILVFLEFAQVLTLVRKAVLIFIQKLMASIPVNV